MKKVLIFCPNLRNCNGVANVIMNQYKKMINNEFSVDFVVSKITNSSYEKIINDFGGKIYCINKKINIIKNILFVRKIFKINRYDIVHINHGGFCSFLLIYFARKTKIKGIIWHSHNTNYIVSLKGRLKIFLNKHFGIKKCNVYLACTKKAGLDAFQNKKFLILNNAIDLNKFQFNENYRITVRHENNIGDNQLVIGTVCRYAMQKNPFFMLDIISAVKKTIPDVKFLWVGSSISEKDKTTLEIHKYIMENNLIENIILVGSKDDVYKYYSAMDIFIMPSLWEGLGISYLEAQANGLLTLASDVVPEETNVTPLINYLSINNGVDEWCNIILNSSHQQRKKCDYSSLIKEKGFDLSNYDDELSKIYNKIIFGRK